MHIGVVNYVIAPELVQIQVNAMHKLVNANAYLDLLDINVIDVKLVISIFQIVNHVIVILMAQIQWNAEIIFAFAQMKANANVKHIQLD